MDRSPKAYTLGSLIELESCITLKHSKCWNASSKLSTKRELGVGLGQLTKAYTNTGAIRFDALAEIRQKHPRELHELSWKNIEKRPDLQIKAVILKVRDNYKYFRNTSTTVENALYFADAGYNGGNAGVVKEQRACKLSPGCDPFKWFGHVELYCMKSRVVLYGNRSACDINRHHVQEVFLVRANKYRKFWY